MSQSQAMIVPLGKDETVLVEQQLTHSVVLFFLKSTFQLTTKRLIIRIPNVFLLFFPFGSKVETYPLRNVSSVVSVFRLKFVKLAFGGLILVIGLNLLTESLFGVLVLLLGALIIVDSLVLGIIVRAAGGEISAYRIALWQKDLADRLVNQINQAIADCSDR